MVTVLVVLLAIIIGLIVIVALYIFSTQRTLVNLDELCKNAFSQISVQLNSRWDALMALAQTATQYAQHESQTIIQTIQARKQTSVTTPAEYQADQSAFASVFSRLMAVAEAYPQLQAANLYKETMDGIRQYEEDVRMSRMVYNDTATKMNRMVRQWPSSFVANMLGFGQKEYLKEDEEKKKAYPDLYPNQQPAQPQAPIQQPYA